MKNLGLELTLELSRGPLGHLFFFLTLYFRLGDSQLTML